VADQDTRRHVALERTAGKTFTVANDRGGTITVGDGSGGTFTPVELLLASIAACTAIDVDVVTARRAEPDSFRVEVSADKVRDHEGSHLAGIEVTFAVAFPAGPDGDKAREVLPGIVQVSHDRLCTVSRTVEIGAPVTSRLG
jgi:putative redox protein